jgi:hypothetical protein
VQHARYLPPLIDAHFLESATRKQYVEMRDAMIHRRRANR